MSVVPRERRPGAWISPRVGGLGRPCAMVEAVYLKCRSKQRSFHYLLPPLTPLCIFANKEGCMESDLGSSHTTMVEWANERHTGPHVSCEAGDGAHWDRGGGTLGPGRIGSEMFARGSWHVQGCQHPAVFNIYKNKTRTLKVKQ